MLVHDLGLAGSVMDISCGDRSIDARIDISFITDNRKLQPIGIEDAPTLLYQSDDSLLLVRNEVGNFKMFPEIISMDSLVILDIERRINLLWKWMHSLA